MVSVNLSPITDSRIFMSIVEQIPDNRITFRFSLDRPRFIKYVMRDETTKRAAGHAGVDVI